MGTSPRRHRQGKGKSEMKRQHDDKHLTFIRTLPCAICADNTSTEAAHVRAADPRFAKRAVGMSEKPDDMWVTPLCGKCHKRQHAMSEQHFWHLNRRDPHVLAMALWHNSGDADAADTILRYWKLRK